MNTKSYFCRFHFLQIIHQSFSNDLVATSSVANGSLEYLNGNLLTAAILLSVI